MLAQIYPPHDNLHPSLLPVPRLHRPGQNSARGEYGALWVQAVCEVSLLLLLIQIVLTQWSYYGARAHGKYLSIGDESWHYWCWVWTRLLMVFIPNVFLSDENMFLMNKAVSTGMLFFFYFSEVDLSWIFPIPPLLPIYCARSDTESVPGDIQCHYHQPIHSLPADDDWSPIDTSCKWQPWKKQQLWQIYRVFFFFTGTPPKSTNKLI